MYNDLLVPCNLRSGWRSTNLQSYIAGKSTHSTNGFWKPSNHPRSLPNTQPAIHTIVSCEQNPEPEFTSHSLFPMSFFSILSPWKKITDSSQVNPHDNRRTLEYSIDRNVKEPVYRTERTIYWSTANTLLQWYYKHHRDLHPRGHHSPIMILSNKWRHAPTEGFEGRSDNS